MFTIKSKYDILKIVNTAKEEKEDPKMKRKRTHTILATITLISVILTSACTAGSASSTTSSAPETAVTTTVPAVTGTVIDRIDEPKAEATTAQTTATTAVTTTKPQETKKAETTTTTTKAVTTAKPETTTTAATTKPAPEWTESKASGTKYVNTDCYSRKKAVLGAETVKLYSVNDTVTVTAKTDTGYFKLSDDSFIHGDYLSDSKTVIQTTTTAKKAETPKPATTTTKKQESKPAETKWKFTKSDCEYIIEECYKWADKNGYKYKRVNEIKYPNGGYWDYSNGEEVWVDVKRNCQYGEVYKNSSWDTTYKTVGHPYFWGSARNEQVINKNEEIISTITFMCNDIKYYNEEGYTPVLDFTPYSEFVSYTKDRPGFIGCSNLVDDGTIDYILFVIYGA